MTLCFSRLGILACLSRFLAAPAGACMVYEHILHMACLTSFGISADPPLPAGDAAATDLVRGIKYGIRTRARMPANRSNGSVNSSTISNNSTHIINDQCSMHTHTHTPAAGPPTPV